METELSSSSPNPKGNTVQPCDESGSEYIRIADFTELKPHGQFTKWVEDHDILVYEHEDQIKAVSNICPHFGGPVGFHKMQGGYFTCLWHNYKFSAEDGRCITNKHLCLRQYKLKVEDGGIWVQLVEVPSGTSQIKGK